MRNIMQQSTLTFDQCLQAFRHTVKVFPQVCQFILSNSHLCPNSGIKLAASFGFECVLKRSYRAREIQCQQPGEEQADDASHHNRHKRRKY